MEQLVIDRSKWRTGQTSIHGSGRGHTMLLNKEGFMCCLGFLCLSRGVSDSDILECGEPAEVDDSESLGNMIRESHGDYLDQRDILNSDFTAKAIEINDAKHFTNREEREKQLIELFKSYSIDLLFEGEYTLPDDAIRFH